MPTKTSTKPHTSTKKKAPKKGKVKSFAYVSHQISDFDKAREFYSGLLGLKSTGTYPEDNPTWEEYDVNGEAFAVWKASKMTPAYFKKLKITGAVAFEVTDIAALCERLEAAGVEFLQKPENNGHCILAYVKDPDGNIVTLHQLTEHATKATLKKLLEENPGL